MVPIQILPDAHAWVVDAIDEQCNPIQVDLHCSRTTGICPGCAQASARQHSTYMRTVGDLPWSDILIHLHLHVRRFFCDNLQCKRQTFSEQVPSTVAPYARRTQRLTAAQNAVAFALGGEPGARLAQTLKMPLSPDTLLRSIRRSPESPLDSPRILGIDDWAMRKGHRYGTIIINLEQNTPLDLLPDRETATVATWLKQHPGVEIVARDRANAYAEGIRQGAPHATQVADRWHLLHNLQEAVKRFMDRHHTALQQVKVTNSPPKATPSLPETTVERAESNLPPADEVSLVLVRRAKRLQNYQVVKSLYQQGVNQRAIARQLHLHRKTIKRYVAADIFPERPARRTEPDPLEPFRTYLERQWQTGCHNALQLWREISQQGYTGIVTRRSVSKPMHETFGRCTG